MRNRGGDQQSESAFRRLLNALTQSAEYAVAAALIFVCLIVGAAWWLRSNGRPERTPSTTDAAQPSAQVTADESARLRADEETAVRDLQQNLEAHASEAQAKRQAGLRAEEEARRRAEE